MADEYNYDKLLEKARKQLPEKVFKHERLEMPKLSSLIEGNRTFVKRFTDAVNIIRRDPKHVMKYLAKELGSQANMEGTSAVFQGKFGAYTINTKFIKYVEQYVLCSECKKPDTTLIKENRMTFVKCEACGAKKHVADIK
ncbi:MAG: translation initiation factor IF-2 subunit beta [Candidatus Aenigmarchaeota archaeon]|nr:translation initiation factor IF-2 subunit beta [Candidatus Aenigmarchaeota archaeon]